MQFGCCAKIDQAEAVHAAGFDYLEAGVTSLIPDQDDAAFAPVLARYKASPIPVRAFNGFLPGDLKIVGPEVDEARAKMYVKRAIERIELIGATTAVIGSGGSRRVPDGFSRDEATRQIVRFLSIVADETDKSTVTVAIEPLNRKESKSFDFNNSIESSRWNCLLDIDIFRIMSTNYSRIDILILL